MRGADSRLEFDGCHNRPNPSTEDTVKDIQSLKLLMLAGPKLQMGLDVKSREEVSRRGAYARTKKWVGTSVAGCWMVAGAISSDRIDPVLDGGVARSWTRDRGSARKQQEEAPKAAERGIVEFTLDHGRRRHPRGDAVEWPGADVVLRRAV